MEETKVCRVCQIQKHISEFCSHRKYKDGLNAICRKCANEERKIYEEKHKDKLNEMSRKRYKNDEVSRLLNKLRCKEYLAKNRIKILLSRVKKRAKSRNLPFDIEVNDIVIPNVCPILGIPLKWGGHANSPNLPSLDRIDNTKGYVKGNIHIISLRANNIKRDSNVEEMYKIYAYINEKISIDNVDYSI